MPADTPRTREAVAERVARALREAIDAGRYRPGMLLPSEKLIAATLQVSGPTVREALAMLTAEGRVRTTKGIGTLVLGLPVPRHLIRLDPADPWRGLTPSGDPHCHRQAANNTTAALLHVEPREALACVDQTAIHQDTGVLVRTKRSLPFASFDGMNQYPDPFEDRAAIIEALAEHRGPLTAVLRIGAAIPRTADREDLGLGLGALVLYAVIVTHAADHRGLLLDTLRCNAADAEITAL